MRRFGPSFPKHMRERIEDAQRSMDFQASLHDTAPIPLGPPLPPKRQRNGAAATEDREGTLQARILQFLLNHPKVAFVGRFNRGRFMTEYNGRKAWYSMNSIPGFSDVHGLLKTGRALYVECKRPGEKPSEKQQHFLDLAVSHGALAFVAYDISDCERALASA